MTNAPIILTYPQRSDEWFIDRRGIPTASMFDAVMPTRSEKYPDKWWNYLYQLVAERMLDENFGKNVGHLKAVQDGIEREDPARNAFERHIGSAVEQVGLVMPPHKRYACSPDGFVFGRRHILEIKCPTEPTEMRYLLQGLKSEYWTQIQGQLMICAVDKAHFWGWHPRMPPVHIEIGRDESFMALLSSRLQEFCDKLDSETVRAEKLFDEWREDENRQGRMGNPCTISRN